LITNLEELAMIIRTTLYTLLLCAICAIPAGAAPPPVRDGSHDFDFWFGQWNGVHHKLKQRLANSSEWEDFTGTAIARPLLGGRANTDENVFHSGKEGAGGIAFRLYDPQQDLWSIYWIGTTSYTVDAPMVGRFVNGVGTFYGDDTWQGKPVRVRFIWSKIDLTHCHWEQAYSADGGKSWETNWLMDFTRTAF
jgi:hypothetical protein